MLFSPLEQFKLKIFFPLTFFQLDFSVNTTTVYLFLFFVVSLLVFRNILIKSLVIPSYSQYIFEGAYSFVLNIVNEQAGKKAQPYFPFIYTLFFFLLWSNLIGLFPFSFTITSQFILMIYLAILINFSLVIIGIVKSREKFLLLFINLNIPVALIPLITVIELMSYLLRSISLSLRIFANMVAGHVLLMIIAGFLLTFLSNNLILPSFIVFIVIEAIYVLEIAIAFIQAYVFITLVSIYLNDSLNPGH